MFCLLQGRILSFVFRVNNSGGVFRLSVSSKARFPAAVRIGLEISLE